MKHAKKIAALCLALCLSFVCCLCVGAADAEHAKLQFGEDGKFTILHLSDTQDDQYPAHELKKFLWSAIQTANPDLIVFTGDLVEDTRWGDPGVDDFGLWEGVVAYHLKGVDKEKTRANSFKAADYVLSIFEESGVPFAMVQGNNDYHVNISNDDWLKFYAKYSNCITTDMSETSDGIDYRLPIYSADGTEVKLNVYCMDSVEKAVSAESLDWYVADSNAQKQINGKTVPAFVFQHIPVDEMSNFFTTCSINDPAAVPYGFKSYKLTDHAHGYFQKVYQSDNGKSDEFAAWKQQNDVIAAFFGHMHTEGYTGTYDGIELNLTYGCEFAKSGPYGMRVITLNADDVTNYGNQLYTYDDGAFTADPYNAPAKTLTQKIKLFVKSWLNIAKTLIRKVLPI